MFGKLIRLGGIILKLKNIRIEMSCHRDSAKRQWGTQLLPAGMVLPGAGVDSPGPCRKSNLKHPFKNTKLCLILRLV